MSGQLATYLGPRTELDGWLDQFGSQAVPFGQAEGYLSDALSQRQQVVNQMASLDPPASVAAGHDGRLGSVRGEWEAALARAVRSVRERRLPVAPKV